MNDVAGIWRRREGQEEKHVEYAENLGAQEERRRQTPQH